MEEFQNIPEKSERKKEHTSRNVSQKNVLQLLLESISCSSGIEKSDDSSSTVENAIKKCKHKT